MSGIALVCGREAGERARPSGEQEERRWGSAEIGGSVCCLQRDGVVGRQVQWMQMRVYSSVQ